MGEFYSISFDIYLKLIYYSLTALELKTQFITYEIIYLYYKNNYSSYNKELSPITVNYSFLILKTSFP